MILPETWLWKKFFQVHIIAESTQFLEDYCNSGPNLLPGDNWRMSLNSMHVALSSIAVWMEILFKNGDWQKGAAGGSGNIFTVDHGILAGGGGGKLSQNREGTRIGRASEDKGNPIIF